MKKPKYAKNYLQIIENLKPQECLKDDYKHLQYYDLCEQDLLDALEMLRNKRHKVLKKIVDNIDNKICPHCSRFVDRKTVIEKKFKKTVNGKVNYQHQDEKFNYSFHEENDKFVVSKCPSCHKKIYSPSFDGLKKIWLSKPYFTKFLQPSKMEK